MLRRLLLATLFASAVGLTVADEPKKDPPENAKSFADKLKDLRTEMGKASSAAVKGINAEKDKDARAKLIAEYRKIPGTFAPKFLELAKSDPKAKEAIDATLMAVSAGGDTAKDATDHLLATYADDDRLSGVVGMFGQMPGGKKLIETLGEKSKSKSVLGALRVQAVKAEAEEAESRPADAREKAFADLAGKLKAIASEFGTAKIVNPAGKTDGTVADAANKVTFFMEHLVVGKPAPAITGTTLDDKKVKLSDYKGKVVVFDIWATWCGPCVAMIPHETEMVKKLKDKPFVLLSVSADEEKETLTKFLEKKPMPWDHWWAGRGEGPGGVLDTFQVRFFPSVYVLDAKGVIRHKHIRGDELEKAVEKLIEEAEKAGK